MILSAERIFFKLYTNSIACQARVFIVNNSLRKCVSREKTDLKAFERMLMNYKELFNRC